MLFRSVLQQIGPFTLLYMYKWPPVGIDIKHGDTADRKPASYSFSAAVLNESNFLNGCSLINSFNFVLTEIKNVPLAGMCRQ